MSDSNSSGQAGLAPRDGDTGRTLGWKMILEAAKHACQENEPEKAERLYKTALEKAEHRLGPNHVVLAYLLMEMADFYFSENEYGNAHLLHTRAREILGKHVDEEHSALQ
ncbi:MAG: tetratricopeptide repeat protein [Cyanobacteria bacterium SZAS LIN-2]|nr:tetratricopeptide repeat protein [Cyanobacteria bacterium SZAS LIN-3]MBS1998175.1 tetratricopeptide repeat protein [Cyanobacteria bacterium SZAS LIN-2]MBS2010799.1 tetratricopeptide repeat protein [Cyanobacteria bacterium SZAS TMP-1]